MENESSSIKIFKSNILFMEELNFNLSAYTSNKYCLILRISIKIDNLVPMNIKTRKNNSCVYK